MVAHLNYTDTNTTDNYRHGWNDETTTKQSINLQIIARRNNRTQLNLSTASYDATIQSINNWTNVQMLDKTVKIRVQSQHASAWVHINQRTHAAGLAGQWRDLNSNWKNSSENTARNAWTKPAPQWMNAWNYSRLAWMRIACCYTREKGKTSIWKVHTHTHTHTHSNRYGNETISQRFDCGSFS